VGREERASKEKCHKVLSPFGERLLPRVTQTADMLSYANRRRLEVARALVPGPRLILLDEPTAGMNPHETQGIVDLIHLIRQRGHTVLVIEHKMKVVMTVSDRIVMLDDTAQNLRNNPLMQKAYLGVA